MRNCTVKHTTAVCSKFKTEEKQREGTMTFQRCFFFCATFSKKYFPSGRSEATANRSLGGRCSTRWYKTEATGTSTEAGNDGTPTNLLFFFSPPGVSATCLCNMAIMAVIQKAGMARPMRCHCNFKRQEVAQGESVTCPQSTAQAMLWFWKKWEREKVRERTFRLQKEMESHGLEMSEEAGKRGLQA